MGNFVVFRVVLRYDRITAPVRASCGPCHSRSNMDLSRCGHCSAGQHFAAVPVANQRRRCPTMPSFPRSEDSLFTPTAHVLSILVLRAFFCFFSTGRAVLGAGAGIRLSPRREPPRRDDRRALSCRARATMARRYSTAAFLGDREAPRGQVIWILLRIGVDRIIKSHLP